MRVLFAGNKERGAACLEAVLADGHTVAGVLAPPKGGDPGTLRMVQRARELRVPVFDPGEPNDPDLLKSLKALAPEAAVLAGYGPIVRKPFIDLAPRGCFNLHAGK